MGGGGHRRADRLHAHLDHGSKDADNGQRGSKQRHGALQGATASRPGAVSTLAAQDAAPYA